MPEDTYAGGYGIGELLAGLLRRAGFWWVVCIVAVIGTRMGQVSGHTLVPIALLPLVTLAFAFACYHTHNYVTTKQLWYWSQQPMGEAEKKAQNKRYKP